MPRLLPLVVIAAFVAAPSVVRADGDPVALGPPTVFERFVLSACSPCIRETYPIATLPVAAVPLPGFPRTPAASGARPGEIVIEVLHAHQLGRPDWRSLALRVTMSVTTGTGGDLFRLGTGLLDGADVPALAQAVGEMARIVTAPRSDPRPDTVDADYHGGTLRIGVLQLRGESIGYVQTGDLPTMLQRAVWDVPATLYLPVKDLQGMAAALGEAAARIQQVRGN
jgi:hypothetical protein